MANPTFPRNAKTLLHREYGYYCSVCLTRQTPTGSQCAHLYPRADLGQTMVNDAKSLGLLDPDSESKYSRNKFANGIIQCATCHQGYFTPGYLVFSPAFELLQWIMEQLDDLKPADAHSVWKIFHLLEEGPHFGRFYQLYSLIPRFDPENLPPAGWYTLYCNLPPIHIMEEEGKFTPVESRRIQRIRRDVPRFRIFDVRDNIQRNARGLHDVRPGVIRLLPAGTKQKHPTNFWRIRVPCHVMLYLFIDAIESYEFDNAFPEVALAMKIYKRLEKIKSKSERMGNGAKLNENPPPAPPLDTLSTDFLRKAAAAYRTPPSSPPRPGRESDSSYFSLGGSSVAATRTARRAVKSLTTPQRGLPTGTRSSRSSPLHIPPPTTRNAHGSDGDSDHGPPDSESSSSDGSGSDGDGDSPHGSDRDPDYVPPDSESSSSDGTWTDDGDGDSDGSGTDGDGNNHSDVGSQESPEEGEGTEED